MLGEQHADLRERAGRRAKFGLDVFAASLLVKGVAAEAASRACRSTLQPRVRCAASRAHLPDAGGRSRLKSVGFGTLAPCRESMKTKVSEAFMPDA